MNIEQVQKAFQAFDTNGDGQISMEGIFFLINRKDSISVI